MQVFKRVFKSSTPAQQGASDGQQLGTKSSKKKSKNDVAAQPSAEEAEKRRLQLEKKTRQLHERGGAGVASANALKASEVADYRDVERETRVKFVPAHENEHIHGNHADYESLVRVNSAPGGSPPRNEPLKSALKKPGVNRFSTN